MRTARALAAGGALLASTVLAGCDPAPQPWHPELVGGSDATGGARDVTFSADGTTMAFAVSDLREETGAVVHDVYVRDLTTGTTTLVSVNADGTGGGNADSYWPRLSADGTEVAFVSTASDLGPRDTNNQPDAYVRDLITGTTTLVSVNAEGTDSGDWASYVAAISPDGTTVVFNSLATDLGPHDTHPSPDIYARDLTTGTTTLVSANGDGTDSANAGSGALQLVADGTRLLFQSDASDLGPTDTNGNQDVYMHDFATGTNTLVSTNATGADSGNDNAADATSSVDGTTVAFRSRADDLGPTDTNDVEDVYVRDLATGTTTLASVNRTGTNGGNRGVANPVLSADGSTVVWTTDASDLGPVDRNGRADVYARDLRRGRTFLASANGARTSGQNGAPGLTSAVSPDGERVAFSTLANDLGPTDTNDQPDVYAYELASDTTTLVSVDAERTRAAGGTEPVFAPAGTRVAFVSGPRLWLATLHGADLAAGLDVEPGGPVAPGDRLTYRLTAANRGPDEAEDTAAALLLAEGTDFTDATASGGACAAPTADQPRLVRCQLGDLAAGDERAVTITATVTAPSGPAIAAAGAASSATADPAPGNNLVVVESPVGPG